MATSETKDWSAITLRWFCIAVAGLAKYLLLGTLLTLGLLFGTNGELVADMCSYVDPWEPHDIILSNHYGAPPPIGCVIRWPSFMLFNAIHAVLAVPLYHFLMLFIRVIIEEFRDQLWDR